MIMNKNNTQENQATLEEHNPTIEEVEKILNIKLIRDPELFVDIKKFVSKDLFKVKLDKKTQD